MTPELTAELAALLPKYVERRDWESYLFAPRDARIYAATVPKRRMLAYFVDREASEAVIDPSQIPMRSASALDAQMRREGMGHVFF